MDDVKSKVLTAVELDHTIAENADNAHNEKGNCRDRTTFRN